MDGSALRGQASASCRAIRPSSQRGRPPKRRNPRDRGKASETSSARSRCPLTPGCWSLHPLECGWPGTPQPPATSLKTPPKSTSLRSTEIEEDTNGPMPSPLLKNRLAVMRAIAGAFSRIEPVSQISVLHTLKIGGWPRPVGPFPARGSKSETPGEESATKPSDDCESVHNWEARPGPQ